MRRNAVDGISRRHRTHLGADPRHPADAVVFCDRAGRDSAPLASVHEEPRIFEVVGRLHRGQRDSTCLLFHPGHQPGAGVVAHPQLRGSQDRDCLLQHPRGDLTRGRVSAQAGVRGRGHLVRPGTERSRTRHDPHARGPDSISGCDRRRRPRNRHRIPVARFQLHVSRRARNLHSPHGPHRTRGQARHRDFVDRPNGSGAVLLPQASVQDSSRGARVAFGGGDPIAPRRGTGAATASGTRRGARVAMARSGSTVDWSRRR